MIVARDSAACNRPGPFAGASRLAVPLLAACCVAVWFDRSRVVIPDSATAGRSAAVIETRINPNTATATELATLPRIGPALAERIVARRNELAASSPGGVVFRSIADLDPVKGIGPATLRAIESRLTFGP